MRVPWCLYHASKGPSYNLARLFLVIFQCPFYHRIVSSKVYLRFSRSVGFIVVKGAPGNLPRARLSFHLQIKGCFSLFLKNASYYLSRLPHIISQGFSYHISPVCLMTMITQGCLSKVLVIVPQGVRLSFCASITAFSWKKSIGPSALCQCIVPCLPCRWCFEIILVPVLQDTPLL